MPSAMSSIEGPRGRVQKTCVPGTDGRATSTRYRGRHQHHLLEAGVSERERRAQRVATGRFWTPKPRSNAEQRRLSRGLAVDHIAGPFTSQCRLVDSFWQRGVICRRRVLSPLAASFSGFHDDLHESAKAGQLAMSEDVRERSDRKLRELSDRPLSTAPARMMRMTHSAQTPLERRTPPAGHNARCYGGRPVDLQLAKALRAAGPATGLVSPTVWKVHRRRHGRRAARGDHGGKDGRRTVRTRCGPRAG